MLQSHRRCALHVVMAAELVLGTTGRAGEAGDCALHALMGAGGSGESTLIYKHSQTFREGAEVHFDCADGEAGDPAPLTSIVFPPGSAA